MACCRSRGCASLSGPATLRRQAISVAPEPTKPVTAVPGCSLPNDNVKITPRQAEELFHSVDEIMQFDSKETGLPIKREVKRKLTSRDEVVVVSHQAYER